MIGKLNLSTDTPFKCFLDAYKGYHQIQMAEEDEEKTAFHTNQGVFCYTKMLFGLKNAGATYQQLMDKAFEKHIGRNLEVYVDDLVIKIHTEHEILRYVEETFRNLRRINMKLNPKKCTFGSEEGAFLGYVVSMKGIKACPENAEAVMKLQFPETLKEAQSLNVKLATERAFQGINKCIAELPMVTAPRPREELIMYLCAAREAVSAVLLAERDSQQIPVYFVSRTLQAPEKKINGKLVLALVHATRRLRRYFQAHPIIVITDQPIKQILSRPENTRRMLKWKFELESFVIIYRPRTSIHGQILADFIAERPDEEDPPVETLAEEVTPEPWTLFTDGSSCLKGSGAGLILTSPESEEFTYALRLEFDASNNEAEYEALIASLRITKQMRVKKLVAKVDSQLMANQINRSYEAKEQSMIQYLEKAKALTDNFKMFSIEQYLAEGTLPADTKKAWVVKIKSRQYTMINDVLYRKSFLEPWLRCVGPTQAEYVVRDRAVCTLAQGTFPEAHGKVRFLIVAIDYFTKWIEAKPVAMITGNQVKRFERDNIVYKFGLSREIISDNEKQFRDNPLKDWCEKLNIKQRFASIKHPQTNGQVERANRNLREGIKARLDEENKNWVEEVPHVLWAHRTMIKTSNGDTSFSLAYGTEAVIPVEIGMPSLRCAEVNQA
ncbi:reverse transcriptase domain-containing protein [Tanacetum coccineum]